MTKPIIIVSITGRNREDILEEAREMKAENVPMVEWRADLWEDLQVFHATKVVRELKEILQETPLIFTYRTVEEGGAGEFLQEKIHELLLAVIEQKQADFVDVEYRLPQEFRDVLLLEAKKNERSTILSSHDFEGTMEQGFLKRQLEEMKNLEATVLKVVTMAHSGADVLRLMSASYEFTTQYLQPVITMAMGEVGTFSRIAGNLTNSSYTFASFRKLSAPGQLSYQKTKAILDLLNDDFGEVE